MREGICGRPFPLSWQDDDPKPDQDPARMGTCASYPMPSGTLRDVPAAGARVGGGSNKPPPVPTDYALLGPDYWPQDEGVPSGSALRSRTSYWGVALLALGFPVGWELGWVLT